MPPTDIFAGTSGPRDAKVALVAESYGFEEAAQNEPLVGQSGQELDRMLAEAGIKRADCFATNVVSERPQGNDMWRFFHPVGTSSSPAIRGLQPMDNVVAGVHTLYQQLEAVRPKVIVALGNYALWALTNCSGVSTITDIPTRNRYKVPNGIMNWRGSQWYADAAPGELATTRLVPVIHPAAILRAWYNRSITVHDLRERVAKLGLHGGWRPEGRTVLAPPTYDQARHILENWIGRMDRGNVIRIMNDIETARQLITCIGFSDSSTFAMSIPFIKRDGVNFESFYSVKEEQHLVRLMRRVLTHPNVRVEGQNYLYDMQYISRDLLCVPRLDFDSMSAHHLLFPGTPKGLDYLSSMYCEHHWFWKEDHKEWDMSGTIEDLLVYNCEDVLRNFEVNTVLRDLIPKMGQVEQWNEEMEKNFLALDMMQRGVKIDAKHRGAVLLQLMTESGNLANWFLSILPQHIVSPNAKKGAAPWYQSPSQQKRFFSEELGLKLPTNRKTESETFGKEALIILRERHPEYAKIFDNLEMLRSINVFHKTFIKAELEPGDRMKCMFNTSGTETFRWSSSSNAFNRGTNLQNIPKGEED